MSVIAALLFRHQGPGKRHGTHQVHQKIKGGGGELPGVASQPFAIQTGGWKEESLQRLSIFAEAEVPPHLKALFPENFHKQCAEHSEGCHQQKAGPEKPVVKGQIHLCFQTILHEKRPLSSRQGQVSQRYPIFVSHPVGTHLKHQFTGRLRRGEAQQKSL